jgi:hypothetical protein
MGALFCSKVLRRNVLRYGEHLENGASARVLQMSACRVLYFCTSFTEIKLRRQVLQNFPNIKVGKYSSVSPLSPLNCGHWGGQTYMAGLKITAGKVLI